jgi:predicted  nucleic acid-binding Zn-ribbon protein
LKKLEAAQESFGNESCWLLDLAQAVEGADWQCLQIISDLDKISERLRRNQKKSTQKSTIKPLTPKVQAKLNKTLDTVLALSALFEKRKRDAGRVSYLLLDEFLTKVI